MLTNQLKLHFIIFIWSFTAILGVLITIDAIELVFYRTAIAALGMGVVMLFMKKPFVIRKRDILKLLGTGALVGIHWITFFMSAKVSKISVCLAGIATCSLFTAFIEPLFTKQKIKIYEVGLGVLVIIGLYIIFKFEYNHVLGLSLALVSSVLAAVFSVLNGKFAKVYDSTTVTFYEMTGGAIIALIALPIYNYFYPAEDGIMLHLPSMTDFGYLLILSLVCTVYAFYGCIQVMKHLSVFYVNLSINMEPVYGIVLAMLIFGEKEQMTDGFYLGAGMILLSVLLYPVMKRVARLASTKLKAEKVS